MLIHWRHTFERGGPAVMELQRDGPAVMELQIPAELLRHAWVKPSQVTCIEKSLCHKQQNCSEEVLKVLLSKLIIK